MAEKNVQARIQHKHDTEANWNKATGFIPKAGELIIYDKDENHNYLRVKIGDGSTLVSDLEFVVDTSPDLLATTEYVDQSISSIDSAVLYTEQTLTDEQKAQARTNINAVSIEEVEELLGIEEEFSVTGELVEFDLDVEPGTELNVVSKIHRDSTWGESNKLVLHHVSGTNFVDLSSYLGGAGKVYEKNGLTAIVNANGTVTITGTNTSDNWTEVVNLAFYNGEHSTKIYPAGTYIIPKGLTINIRAAQYPDNVTINGIGINLTGKIVVPEPFRILTMYIAYAGGATVDTTIPLGLFYGDSIPETGYEYVGNLYTATFDHDIYEGEYNWSTGELKDADGNTVAYYEPKSIKSLSGINYFWTGFGENVVSNKVTDDLEKVVIRLGETAPEETVPSICDFTLKPTTKNYSINVYGDSRNYFAQGNVFHGLEVPLITTRGKVAAYDIDGEVAYTATVPELINYKGISDIMTGNEITKRWSDRFYITREPDIAELIDDGSGTAVSNPNSFVIWEFSKKDFEKFGLPIEAMDIPLVSPYFVCTTEEKIATQKLSYSDAYCASFSYDAENDKYILKCRARDFYGTALYQWTSAYFCYPLKEEVIRTDAMLSMYVDSGYTVSFDQDDAFDPFLEYSLTQGWCPFMNDTGGVLWNPNTKPADVEAAKPLVDVTPNVGIFVPRSVEDALYEAEHIAKRLNRETEQIDDYEVNSYGWIGEGDGTTDYTEKIQSKLTEIHNTANGGTIYLGPGTYPISGSLIVYDNTRIIGDGQTVIEQTADNTHALILSGSNITIKDLTVKLSGACTTLTACMYVNSYNHPNVPDAYDSSFPENMYAQNLTVENVLMTGTYSFERLDGHYIVSDDYENYMGVGIYGRRLFFNYAHVDNVHFKFLMAGVYGGGGSNYYNIMSEFNKYGLYITKAGDNTYFVGGHSYYANDKDGNYITMSDAIAYVESDTYSTYHLRTFDVQGYNKVIFLDSKATSNKIDIQNILSVGHGLWSSHEWNILKWFVVDYGRGNMYNQYKHTPFHIGSYTATIGQAPQSELSNPVIQNALSGAGIWGDISSNVEFTNYGITLRDVCRYPSEKTITSRYLPYIVSAVAPSVDSPIEIVIDYSNRPIISCPNYFIQFHHAYVASDYVVSFDTTNTGVFDYELPVTGNTNITEYFDYPQRASVSFITYRMKISFTKALQISNLQESMTDKTFDYNPDGLIGICNIGMTINDYAGRSFLGECGGSLYGNVDMHQNTLKNLPTPVDDGDAVSKAYLEEKIGSNVCVQIIKWEADD